MGGQWAPGKGGFEEHGYVYTCKYMNVQKNAQKPKIAKKGGEGGNLHNVSLCKTDRGWGGGVDMVFFTYSVKREEGDTYLL